MKRETESTSRIKRICSTVGVHYTNKTYNNLRTILRIHSMVKKDWSLIEANIKKISRCDAISLLFEKMASVHELSEDEAYEYVCLGLKDGYLINIFDIGLNKVNEFSPDGKIYFRILESLYFEIDRKRDKDIEIELNLSHSAYQNYKKNAVMLIGVYIWKEILPYWENAIDNIVFIENKLNRKGDFSSAFVL